MSTSEPRTTRPSTGGVIGLAKSAAVADAAGFVIGVALPVDGGYTSH